MIDASFAAAWGVAQGIEGWLTEGQARALFEAACVLSSRTAIVEIGSHRGRSTIVLAAAAPREVEVVAVDPFDDPRWGGGSRSYDIFRDNLGRSPCGKSVRIVRGTSREAADDWDGSPVGLVYVDGAHDRASVLVDIDAWATKLEPGGAIYLHDAFSAPGVTLAVLQRFLGSRGFEYLGSVRSLAGFRRRDVSVAEMVVSGVRLLARLPWFARNLVVKAALRHGRRDVALLLGHAGEGFPY